MLEFKQIYGADGAKRAERLRTEIFGDLGAENEIDARAWHIVGYEEKSIIGAARLYPIGDGVFEIDLVGVCDKMRREYIGDLMMKTLQDKAVSEGGFVTEVRSPEETVGFFKRLGYEETGSADGVLFMRKDLTKVCRACCGKRDVQ